MSNNKKRKSDVNIDACGSSSSDPKKDRLWFQDDRFNIQETNEATTSRRKSFFGNVLNKLKSSKDTHKSMSKLETLSQNDTHMSVNSESSLTSNESAKIPNVEKNAGLRTFVNRDSFTPVPPNERSSSSGKKQIEEDSLSISSRMSVETADSVNLDDAMLSSSASAFCTPSRVLNRNSHVRISTRSVPDHQIFKNPEDQSSIMFNSLCNSAVRRAPSTKSEGSVFGGQVVRRSMRMQMPSRKLNASSMEDVPEEEPLSNVTPAQTSEDGDEEVFVNGKEFFAENPELSEGQSRNSISSNRLSTSSEHRKTPGSISRNNSFFRKMFLSKQHPKERRTSEVCDDAVREANSRRSSTVSFGDENSTHATLSLSNHNDSSQQGQSEEKVKLRKKTGSSSSNLTQRISSVFSRRSNISTCKDEDNMNHSMNKSGNRRSTLTGFSSISSGIGSIASEVSEWGSFGGTLGRGGGASVSRNGSKRETDKERIRRFLDNIIISDIPAEDLLKLKIEQLKRRNERSIDEEFETQLDETGSSTSSATQELLNFDVVAIDIKADGSSFSKVSEILIDAEMKRKIKDEMKSRFPSDNCGTVVECEPDLIFVCSSTSNNANTSFIGKDLNESCLSRASVCQTLLIDVRNGISKSIELWNSSVFNRESSTLLMFPMFCSSDNEWDSKETIDAIFCMLDAILNTRRWKPNGRVILAGMTVNNVRLLREKYLELKLSIVDEIEIETHEIDNIATAKNNSSSSSSSTMITKV